MSVELTVGQRLREWLGIQSQPANPPGIQELAYRYWSEEQGEFSRSRVEFERSVRGRISESYFTQSPRAGVVLVDKRNRPFFWRHSYRVYSYYGSVEAPPRLDDVVRRARSEERKWRLLLHGTSQEIVVQAMYGLLVSVMNYIEFARARENSYSRTDSLAESMEGELTRIKELAREFASRFTLQWYLAGMLPGVAVAWLVSRSLAGDNYHLGPVQVSTDLVPCLVFGAIGAVVSVMARITNNNTLEVDEGRGWLLSLIAGGFRPLIGSIFAGALYILVAGGVLANITPPQGREVLFFGGLSFIAGFSERWAQDTIVSSTSQFTPRAKAAAPETRGATSPDPEPPSTGPVRRSSVGPQRAGARRTRHQTTSARSPESNSTPAAQDVAGRRGSGNHR